VRDRELVAESLSCVERRKGWIMKKSSVDGIRPGESEGENSDAVSPRFGGRPNSCGFAEFLEVARAF
jgi:hypothetical protein